MKKSKYVDNTSRHCWGYRPEPGKHTAFVGWRTIFVYNNGKPFLDYVPGRGSCRGLKTDCDRLVKWWSGGRKSPEKWWLDNCSRSYGASVLNGTPVDWKYASDGSKVYAVVERTDGYVYISLYLDRQNGEMTHESA